MATQKTVHSAPINRHPIPNASCINIDGRLFAMRDQLSDRVDRTRRLNLQISLYDLAILELVAHTRDLASVYERIASPGYFDDLAELRDGLFHLYPETGLEEASVIRIFLGKSHVVTQIFATQSAGEVPGHNFTDLTRSSANDPRTAIALFHNILEDDVHDRPTDRDRFNQRIQFLESEGLLAPDVGALQWGNFRRRHPLCQAYGYLRGGTPIDRYYLDRFVELIRPQVRGRVLEIGGRLTNRQLYGFSDVSEYRTLDLAGVGDDMVGDATDPNTVPEQSFDCITAFNVLEHCEHPQAVVNNIHHWLKPGGKAFILVPTTQKLHAAPKDYWRPLPDALKSMFKTYRRCDLHIYGSLITAIASLHGVSAEELSESELNDPHPDYPVVSCVSAAK